MFNRTYSKIVFFLSFILTIISTYMFLTQKNDINLKQIPDLIIGFLFTFGISIFSLWLRIFPFKKIGFLNVQKWGPHIQIYSINFMGLVFLIVLFFAQFEALRNNTYMPTVGVYAGLGFIMGSFYFSNKFKDKIKR